MKISIVIVSYNVKDFISQCIRSIYKSNLNKNDYEIIVVDNDSHDNTLQMIEKEFEEVIIIRNKNNEGFSKAVNQGFAISKGENLCIINPDVIIKDENGTELISVDAHISETVEKASLDFTDVNNMPGFKIDIY